MLNLRTLTQRFGTAMMASAMLLTAGCTYYDDQVRAPSEQDLEDARTTIRPRNTALQEGVFHMQRIQDGSGVRVKEVIRLKKPDLPSFDVAYLNRSIESVLLELANTAGESVVIPSGLRDKTVTLVHSGANFQEMMDIVLGKAGYHYNYINGVWYVTRYPVRNYILEVGQSARRGSMVSKVELPPELANGGGSSGSAELDTDYSDQIWTQVKETLGELVNVGAIGTATGGVPQLNATGITASGQLITSDGSTQTAGAQINGGGLLPPPEVASNADQKLFSNVQTTVTTTGGTISATVDANGVSITVPEGTDHMVSEEDAQPWFKVTESAGLITVRSSPDAHRQIEEYLAQVQDSAQRQVLVEARIVALIRDKTTDRGGDVQANFNSLLNIDGKSALNKIGFFADSRITNTATAGGFFTLTSRSGDMGLVLQSLSKLGDVYTISSPSLMARNNQISRVSVTRQLGYVETEVNQNTTSTGDIVIGSRQDKPKFKNSGTVMSVMPFIGKNRVQMRYRLSVATKAGDTTIKTSIGDSDQVTNLVPELANNVVDQDMVLEFGRVYAIGGLIENNTTVNASYEPTLRQIPGLGEIFNRAKNRGLDTEFLVLLKVSKV